MTFGTFIEPDAAVEDVDDLVAALGVPVYSCYRAIGVSEHLLGQNRVFDRIVEKSKGLAFTYEDQCSAQYYFDLVRTLRDFNGQFDRVVEVGVYLGGSTSFLGGCIEPFDYDLDLVDIHAPFLHFAYERVRRMYPQSTKRIRLFHGDLPTYVRKVMMAESNHSCLVHHDGAHDFNQVVMDMASLYFARKSLCAVIAQDTHLRGTPEHMNFVDLALQAVFGSDLKAAPIGSTYTEFDQLALPNTYNGNYFMPHEPEGLVLPMSENRFRYPHPSMHPDMFLPAE